MWPLDSVDVEQLHFDLTNFCNAKCPECVREIDSNAKPFLDKDMLSLEIIKQRFTKEHLPRIKKIRLCGSFGDPLTHPHLYEITEHFINEWPLASIEVSTNGGLKNKTQWEKLAKLYQGNRYIIFGIDGLEDTNHRYRVGVNWSKLKENFDAFISAGGHAQWQFIVFPWNKHQIFEAREFSINSRFKKFFVIGSHRNSSINPNYTDKETKSIEDELAKIQRFDNEIKNTNANTNTNRKVLPPRNSSMDCEVLNHRDIMVMANGEIYPCCHIGSRMFGNDTKITKWIQLSGGKNSINIYYNSLQEIIKSNFFRYIYESWNLAEHKEMGKCSACIMACEKKFKDEKYII